MASCHLSWPYPLCFPQPPSTCSHSTPACPWHVSVTSQALSIQSPHLEYLPPLFTPIKLIFSGPSQCSLLSKKPSLMSLSNASESFVCGLLFTGMFYLDMSWLMPPGIEEGISLLWLWWKLFLLLLRTSYLHGYDGLWHLTSGASSIFSSYNLSTPGAEAGGSRLPSETLPQTIAISSSKFKFSASDTIGLRRDWGIHLAQPPHIHTSTCMCNTNQRAKMES